MFAMFLAGSLAFGVGMFVMTLKIGAKKVFRSKFHIGPVKTPALLDFGVTFGASSILLLSGTMTGAFAAFLGGLVYSLLMACAAPFYRKRKKCTSKTKRKKQSA